MKGKRERERERERKRRRGEQEGGYRGEDKRRGGWEGVARSYFSAALYIGLSLPSPRCQSKTSKREKISVGPGPAEGLLG